MLKKIVLIDDDPEDIEIMLEVLRSINPEFNTTTFSDPCYALEVLKNLEPSLLPDYIILDVFMHKVDGLECLRQLRQVQELKDVQLLVHSTSELDNDAMKKVSNARVTVFQKPTTFRGFEESFKDFLNH